MKVKAVLHFKFAGLCTFRVSQAHMELCYIRVRLIMLLYEFIVKWDRELFMGPPCLSHFLS